MLREVDDPDKCREGDGEPDHNHGNHLVSPPPGHRESKPGHDALRPVASLRSRQGLHQDGEGHSRSQRQIRVEPLHARATSGAVAAQKNTTPVTTRRAEVVS